jgi:hypothetical protein
MEPVMSARMRPVSNLPRAFALLSAGLVLVMTSGLARADDDARMKQLRLLCARLSGDLTDPGGIAAFRRCLTTHNPLNEIRRDNNIAAPAAAPNAEAPDGYGRNSRLHVADGVERFQVAEANLVYVINSAGKLWRATIEGKDAHQLDEKIAGFQIADGHLFLHSADGTLWRTKLDGSEKTMIDLTVAAFQPINAGLIYVLGTDHTLWRESGGAGKRSEVDHTVKDFQAIDATLVYVLGADGQLWREVGSAQARTLVAKDVVAFQYFPNGDTVYVLAGDGTLWRKSGNANADQVDQAVAAFQAMDAQLVFVLGKNGRLWREIGGRAQAALVDHDVLLSIGKAAFQAPDPGHVFVLGSDHRLWAESMP